MKSWEKGVFALGAGLCFLAFSPLDAPGGPQVAIGGFIISLLAALGFYINGKVRGE
jgi:hypothetical protein